MGKHYEQLTAEERATIMVMTSNNNSARAIARLLRRAPSTISRELTRFAAEATPVTPQLCSTLNSRSDSLVSTPVRYDACAASARARRERHKCRRLSKLATDTVLFGVVQHFLGLAWSPSQIAGTLKLMWPDEPERTVSHETIYTCIYAMPRGELRRELIASLRRAKSKRMPRSRGEDRRGQLPELLSIHVRPPEVNDRAFPGHWEGDLIKGAGNRSAVGVLVERSSALVMLIKLADATATSALEGFTAKLRSVAEPMRKTLTYDQGKEMARHAELTANTGVTVYFCDPHSPWQRGTCENTNGLIRQYLPKGTDLSVHSQAQLDAIADSLNSRPRAMHGFYPPIAVYRAMLEKLNQPDSSIQ
jgi:transposase, IS30 family